MNLSGQPEAPRDRSLSFLQIQTETGWIRMLDRFARWCTPQPGWRILDAGSGPGYLAARLAETGCQAVAVDLNWGGFHQQRLHPDAAAASVSQLPFAARAFDLIAASNLLFLLADPLPALLELRRCLANTGQLALLNPSPRMSVVAAAALADSRGLGGADRASLIAYARRAETGNRWSESELKHLLADAGLSLLETSRQMGPGLVTFARAGRGNFSG